MIGALIATVVDAVFIVALLVSPLGTEFLSLILDDRMPTNHHRRNPTMTAEPTKVDIAQTTCGMCGEPLFDAVLPHTVDGAVMASPEMQTEARRLIAEHEKTCRGNR